MPTSNPNRRGVSVIEAVVGLGLFIVVIAFALMAIEQARGSAVRNQTKDKFRRVGIGMLSYERTHQTFPR